MLPTIDKSILWLYILMIYWTETIRCCSQRESINFYCQIQLIYDQKLKYPEVTGKKQKNLADTQVIITFLAKITNTTSKQEIC
jgi:hypothetical protein